MSAVLIISFLLLTLIAFALHRWQRKPFHEDAPRFAPPRGGGLFSDQSSVAADEHPTNAETQIRILEQRTGLVARAMEGESETLAEAQASGDPDLYREVLDALVERAMSADEDLLALASQIAESGHLRANPKLAAAVIEVWKRAPDKRALAVMLHLAALADDAATYQRAVETVMLWWREGRVPRLSAEELQALVESHYWVLAPEARRSGAGYFLKRMLASVRRELAAAAQRASSSD